MSPATRSSQDAEIARLRARVASLEAEAARQRGSQTSSTTTSTASAHSPSTYDDETVGDASDRAADTLQRKVDESSRLLRAIVLAGLEPLRITAEATQGFVDEVTSRNPADEDLSVSDLMSRVPRDVYAGFSRAWDRAVDAFPETVDTFHERYREARPIRVGRTRRRTTTDTRTGVAPRVVLTIPANGTTTSAPETITLTFNSEVQPRAREFSNSIMVRKDSVPVAGTESQTGTTMLSWKPAVQLTPGMYTVGVYNMESADGVSMSEPFYFSFTVTS